jgi:hypothetical protein
LITFFYCQLFFAVCAAISLSHHVLLKLDTAGVAISTVCTVKTPFQLHHLADVGFLLLPIAEQALLIRGKASSTIAYWPDVAD